MSTVQWTDDLLVDVDLIDEQHKMLVNRLNDFAVAVASHQGPNAITATLDFLIEYTNFHFKDEEKYMAETKYPGLQKQIVQHEAFKKTLASIEKDFREDGATHQLAGDIDTLLVSWLFTHIRAVDLEFGKFLSENGITIGQDG